MNKQETVYRGKPPAVQAYCSVNKEGFSQMRFHTVLSEIKFVSCGNCQANSTKTIFFKKVTDIKDINNKEELQKY